MCCCAAAAANADDTGSSGDDNTNTDNNNNNNNNDCPDRGKSAFSAAAGSIQPDTETTALAVVHRNALTPLMERLYTRHRTFQYKNQHGLDLSIGIEQSWETQGAGTGAAIWESAELLARYVARTGGAGAIAKHPLLQTTTTTKDGKRGDGDGKEGKEEEGDAAAAAAASAPFRWWEGKSVMELGSGLGLASIVAAHMGARVYCTDGDALVVDMCAKNVAKNTATLAPQQSGRRSGSQGAGAKNKGDGEGDEGRSEGSSKGVGGGVGGGVGVGGGGAAGTAAAGTAAAGDDTIRKTAPVVAKLYWGDESDFAAADAWLAVTASGATTASAATAAKDAQGASAPDVILLADVVYGEHPEAWRALVDTLLRFTGPATVALLSHTRRGGAQKVFFNWLRDAGFEVEASTWSTRSFHFAAQLKTLNCGVHATRFY